MRDRAGRRAFLDRAVAAALVQPDGKGRKDDSGKPRYDLIPADAIEELAQLYAIGATKYGDRNWERGMSWGRVFRALMSHAWKWWRGETHDAIDGQHHMASVAWCALALLAYDRRKIGADDRPLLTPSKG